MEYTYNINLVAISVATAWISCLICFEYLRNGRLVGGSITLGSGIWCMHFLGMLAMRTPVPCGYDIKLTLLSYGMTIVGIHLGLKVALRSENTRRMYYAALLMGSALSAMQFLGMASLKMTPPILYHFGLIARSLAITFSVAYAVLWIFTRLDQLHKLNSILSLVIVSLLMSIAISGMQYSAMAAAQFTTDATCEAGAFSMSAQSLTTLVGGGSMLLLVYSVLIFLTQPDTKIWIILLLIFTGEVSFMAILEHSGLLVQLGVGGSVIDGLVVVGLALPALRKCKNTTCALNFERQQLQTLINTLPDLVWLKDINGVYLNCNQRFERFFGAKTADILGKTDYDFVEQDLADSFKANDEAVIRQGCALVNEERITFAEDGHSELLETTIAPVFDQQGKMVGVLGVGHDITKLRQDAELLKQREQQLRAIIDHAPIGIWMTNDEGRYCFVNKTFCDAVGITESQFLAAEQLNDLLGEEVARNCIQSDIECMAQDTPHISHETLSFANGEPHILEITKVNLCAATGKTRGIIGIASDITERLKNQENLKLAGKVFNHAREGIMVTDIKGVIIEVNDAFTRITGYSREEALGQNARILQSGRQSPVFYKDLWQALATHQYWEGEIWNRRKSGEVYVEWLTISAVCNARNEIQHFVGLFSDITAMKDFQQQLQHIAHYDALTHLPNRVLLAERLQQALIHSQRHHSMVAIAFLDLDGFKAINDLHGHDVGDRVLITIAERLKSALRDGDTLARIGGDEFVAVITSMEKLANIELVLQRLVSAAAEYLNLDNRVLQVTASIGVTLFPQDGVDAEQLIRHADQAMYIAKQVGKNRYHLFDVQHDAAIQAQRENLQEIQLGLERDEFILYYQPQINMKSGEIVGAEALIRWQHPSRGLLAPGFFLPTIESHPLSMELGEWVIDTALAQLAQWHAAGLTISVSVNISAYELQQAEFVTHVSTILGKHSGINPKFLELEVLETSAIEDMADVSVTMKRCRELGVRFALDDFGTGYSSLTYLKRLPVDLLKIDQSFIRDMLDDPDDLAIVTGVIGLATAFRRHVIAEGVETIAHGTQLLSMGCDLAQGYGIARPMPGWQIPDWAASWCANEAWVTDS